MATNVDTFIVTSAPEAYDYRGADTVTPFGLMKLYRTDVRLVRIRAANDATYQVNRYLSGAYVAVDITTLEPGDLVGITQCVAADSPQGLWDCECAECRQLQREANAMFADED